MNERKETIILLKAFMWLSLAVNFFIRVLAIWGKNADNRVLIFGGIASLLLFPGGLISVARDLSLEDLSMGMLVAKYIGVLTISCALMLGTYMVSISGGVWITVAILLEALAVIVVIYRYDIKYKVKKIFKRKRDKK